MAVEPYDDPEILDENTIIRRVPELQLVWDENGGRRRRRISSGLYSKSSGPKQGMSVDIEQLMLADRVDPATYVVSEEFIGAVAFAAGDVRALELLVGRDPIRDDPIAADNPYHGAVWRPDTDAGFTRAQKNGLRDAAKWYVQIPDVDLK